MEEKLMFEINEKTPIVDLVSEYFEDSNMKFKYHKSFSQFS